MGFWFLDRFLPGFVSSVLVLATVAASHWILRRNLARVTEEQTRRIEQITSEQTSALEADRRPGGSSP